MKIHRYLIIGLGIVIAFLYVLEAFLPPQHVLIVTAIKNQLINIIIGLNTER